MGTTACATPAPRLALASGRLAQISVCQLGLVTRRQAVSEAECTDRVLAALCRGGVLERVRRGVYRWRAFPSSFEQSALAACLATSTAVASNVTAVQLYGYRLRRRTGRSGPPIIHVSALHGREQPVQPGVRVHHARALPPADRRVREGVPVTSPIRTLKDVAGALLDRDLQDFIGHLISHRLVSASDLRRLQEELATRTGSGRAGSGKLRRALSACGIDACPESLLEHRVGRLLREAGLPEPVPQFAIFDGRHHFVARVDFAFVKRKIAIEADGYLWHSSPQAFARDRRRANRLESLGWKVLRVTAADVEEGLVDLISQLGSLLGADLRDATSPARGSGARRGVSACHHRVVTLRSGVGERHVTASSAAVALRPDVERRSLQIA
jgi:G:T-mismatch repair DNA endonuclease (very short patch repair protein)